MQGFLGRLMGRERIPGLVTLDAVVVSSNDVVSPLTGMRANAFRWTFSVRHLDHKAPGSLSFTSGTAPTPVVHTRLGVRTLSGDMVLEARGGDTRILVPSTAMVDLEFPVAGFGVALDRPLPPELASVLRSRESERGVVFYEELALTEGATVRLTAVLEPEMSEVTTYRGGMPGPGSFQVAPTRGPVRIVEELPELR